MLEDGAAKFKERTTTPGKFYCELHDNPTQCADDDSFEHRIDSQTGECMNEGWVINYDFYIADQDRAEALTQRLWGQSIEEAYEEDEATCYWTQWH